MTKSPQITRKTALLVAAEYVEQGPYDFQQTQARLCETRGGCPLAWLAYALGLEDDIAAFKWLGYRNLRAFFNDMDRATQSEKWVYDPTLAATGLRRLAEQMGD